MIIVDNALRAREAEGKPIRVGFIGAGFMARGLANQILNVTPGIRLTAIFNRHVDRAPDASRYAIPGIQPVVAESPGALEDAIRSGRPVVTGDATWLCRSEQIDVLIDLTGAVEFGAHVTLQAFANGKHVILMNAELDATLGPIL